MIQYDKQLFFKQMGSLLKTQQFLFQHFVMKDMYPGNMKVLVSCIQLINDVLC